MNYLKITKDDLLNGEGVRVTLWTSGCSHHCKNCHNPETWNEKAGQLFDSKAIQEIYNELSKPYISGLTLTGGDPLYPKNRETIGDLVKEVKRRFPNKNIWLWTGYKWNEIKDLTFIKYIDVLIDDEFVQDLYSPNLMWRGSSNQNVIDVKKSLEQNKIILYCK